MGIGKSVAPILALAFSVLYVHIRVATLSACSSRSAPLERKTDAMQGRGHYEEEVIRDTDNLDPQSHQQYSSRGYPRNPVTKRKEKDNVRAANEVMQTTGVVEDAEVAKSKFLEAQKQKNQDTLTALKLLEGGRAVLVGGVWGVLGLRRRILVCHTIYWRAWR